MPRSKESSACYRIEIEERCGCWIQDITGFSVQEALKGTVLSGFVRDQAALHGVLRHLRDLGLTLVSLVRVGGTATREEKHHEHDT